MSKRTALFSTNPLNIAKCRSLFDKIDNAIANNNKIGNTSNIIKWG